MNTIPKPEYPRPERQRSNWLNLNGAWDFCLFPAGEELREAAFAEKRDNWEAVITVPYSWTCPLSGIARDEAGIGWYRRSAAFDGTGRLFLCFGGVDYETTVYINGHAAGYHKGGYGAFELDVTDLWHPGENLIEVRAEDYRREDQLYGKQGYGEIQGIWQTVWLERRPEARITDFTFTTHMDGRVSIQVEAKAPNGSRVTADFGALHTEGTIQEGKALLELQDAEPHLWSPDDPYLYTGKLSLSWAGEKDEIETYFGIREISYACMEGREYPWLTLNGKPIYLNGTLDQAFNPRGFFTYPDEKEIKLEAWRLKRLGLNMVRIHIKAEEPRKLYWMDKLGILVMEDIPCFWGDPTDEAKEAWQQARNEIIARDKNHPSTFCWVIFNETWGLFHHEANGKVYRKDTQEWVRKMWQETKMLDSTRLVEDNSPCNRDHVITDLNSWHFYVNGYEQVKEEIAKNVRNAYPGSAYNYIGGNLQNNAPLMNSECGLVWGVDHSAGDSDLAWQYHYMLNEFRLQDKLCGFVFTEFHDVVNEFNGYYRIDGEDKDFGYQDFCEGMSLKDLHAADFLATDCPPCRDVKAGETVSIPLYLSSYSDARHAEGVTVRYELWHHTPFGRVTDHQGSFGIPSFSYGVTRLQELPVTMPRENAVEVLSLYLTDASGKVISRNFVTFHVLAPLAENVRVLPVSSGRTEGFSNVWQALGGEKLCMGGEGSVTYNFSLKGLKLQEVSSLQVLLEGSSKRVLSKDKAKVADADLDLGFMRGYRVDRGSFENSYWMTDESRLSSVVDVLVNGQLIDSLCFENDWADSRGVLSWNSQPDHRKLDEAGSFGEEKLIQIPSRLLPALMHNDTLTVTFRVKGNGLALYGANAGRYAHGLQLIIR